MVNSFIIVIFMMYALKFMDTELPLFVDYVFKFYYSNSFVMLS